MTKSVRAWAVVNWRGHVLADTTRRTRSDSIDACMQVVDRRERWPAWRDRNGLRCVRVTVTVEDGK